MSQENVVRYWHAAELLQPQSAPKPKKRDTPYASFFHDTTVGQLIPAWSPDSLVAKQFLPKKRTWSHTLYAHLNEAGLSPSNSRNCTAPTRDTGNHSRANPHCSHLNPPSKAGWCRTVS
ncbi:hypothetical protein [Paraburkholderia agricolaris]|jgi:hypothetical protein|uniref:hypothetical protein n=1 Tax=Paraburkholderia agricolaris TaxID=2152888 RepID=UPI001291C09B|nr:hypothetical protein [Paraburkholderia agricolaris]